jgi:hypothetical protein
MSDAQHDSHASSADLAQLKVALRAVQPPPVDEAELRAAFRDARRRQQRARAARLVGSRRARWAAAAVVVLGVAALLGTVLIGGEERAAAPALVAAPPVSALVVTAFQPLLNAPAFSPDASYTVVRVRIPLSSFALVPGTEQGGTVEADLLVGEDGLARGIRFTPADAMLASAQP